MDLTNITLSNGAATPVAVTFNRHQRSDTLVAWQDENSVLAQRAGVSISRRLPTVGNGNRKYSVRVKLPSSTLDSETGQPLYYLSSVMDFIIPEQASQAEIDDMMAYSRHAIVDHFGPVIAAGDFYF